MQVLSPGALAAASPLAWHKHLCGHPCAFSFKRGYALIFLYFCQKYLALTLAAKTFPVRVHHSFSPTFSLPTKLRPSPFCGDPFLSVHCDRRLGLALKHVQNNVALSKGVGGMRGFKASSL